MFMYIWPIALLIVSNVAYQIAAKSMPSSINPFAALSITYIIGAVVSIILYFALNKNANLIQEYQKLNWTPFFLGFSVVGLEVGFIYAYRAGWEVGKLTIVESIIVTIVLLIIGLYAYNEALTTNKIIGIVICLVGLAFLNIK